jgi:hypothetical protein
MYTTGAPALVSIWAFMGKRRAKLLKKSASSFERAPSSSASRLLLGLQGQKALLDVVGAFRDRDQFLSPQSDDYVEINT